MVSRAHLTRVEPTPPTRPTNDELKQNLMLQYQMLVERYRPSTHPFFVTLKHLPSAWVRSPQMLGNLYLNYQAATHALRVMAYQLPYLNTPELRKIKAKFLYEDDASDANGSQHRHDQITRVFQNLGAELPVQSEDFGDLDEISFENINDGTKKFIDTVQRLYPRGLGAWVFVELVCMDFLKAFAQSFSFHFPEIIHEEYFKSVFHLGAENTHGMMAYDLLLQVLEKKPQLTTDTLRDAEEMAEAMNELWTSLENCLFYV